MSGSALTGSEVDRALWALQGYTTTALATVGPGGPHVAGAFYAPERHGDGIRLVMALLRNSQKHREIVEDPRVAFMCSPGTPSRWIQGSGIAHVVEGDAEASRALYARLVEHAPGASVFVDNLPVLPVLVEVTRVKVVEGPSLTPFEVVFGGATPER